MPLLSFLPPLVAIGASTAVLPSTQAAETAIVGARIEIGDGRVVENGTIVVSEGKIVAVGAGLPVPAGARRIDGAGLVVFPGFIDGYSSFGLKLPDAPENVGATPDTLNTAPATMWAGNRKNLRANVRAATSLDPVATFNGRAMQGVTTILLSGGNGSIAGTAALFDLSATPKVRVSEVAEEFVFRGGGRFGGLRDDDLAGAQGAPATPAAPQQNPPGRPPQAPATPAGYAYPGTLFGVFALVRQTLWDAKAYSAETKPKEDATYEALRPLVAGRMPALFTLNTAREIARAAHLADEFGFRMIVNGAPDAYRMVDVLKPRNAPVIVSLEVPDEPTLEVGSSRDAIPLRVLEDIQARYRERMGNARALDAAGITILFRKGPDDYLVGVRKLVTASGLSREAALRAMTINAARAFGAEGQIGTIEVGKSANLVLMTGDFLDPKATIRTTMVAGVEIAAPPAAPDKPAEKPAGTPATPPASRQKEAP